MKARKNKQSVLLSTKGFTLMELLMAAGVTAIAVIALGMNLTTIFGALKDKDAQAEAQSIAHHIEYVLTTGATCTKNFKGADLNAIMATIDSPLYQYDSLEQRGAQLTGTGVDENNKYVKVTKLELERGGLLGTNLMSGTLHVTFKANQATGTQMYRRQIGLNFKMVDGLVETCTAANVQSDYAAKTCEILSQGLNSYDPISGTCMNRFDYDSEVGTKDIAKCDTGWVPKDYGQCDMQRPAGFDWVSFERCVYRTDGTLNCNDSTRVNADGINQPGYAPILPANFSNGGSTENMPVFAPPYALRYNPVTKSCEGYFSQALVDYATAYATANGGTSWIDDFKVVINCKSPRGSHTETTTASTDP